MSRNPCSRAAFALAIPSADHRMTPMPDTLRERLYSTEAIVLARRNLGEADRICDIFSVRSGRKSIIAKGARKAESRNGRSLDLRDHRRGDLRPLSQRLDREAALLA